MNSENSFILLSAFTPGSNSKKTHRTPLKNSKLTLKKKLNLNIKEKSEPQKEIDNIDDNQKFKELFDLKYKSPSCSSPVKYSIISISSTDESFEMDEEISKPLKSHATSLSEMDLKNSLVEIDLTNRSEYITSDDSGNSENFLVNNEKSISFKSAEETSENQISIRSTVNKILICLDSEMESGDKQSCEFTNNYDNSMPESPESVIVIDTSTDQEEQQVDKNSPNIKNSMTIDESVSEAEESCKDTSIKNESTSETDESCTNINSYSVTETNDNIIVPESDSLKKSTKSPNKNGQITVDESCKSDSSIQISNSILIPESEDSLQKKDSMNPITIDETRTTISLSGSTQKLNFLTELNVDVNILVRESEISNKNHQFHQQPLIINETRSTINSNEILIQESENSVPKQNRINSIVISESIIGENSTNIEFDPTNNNLVQESENFRSNQIESNASILTSDNSEIKESDQFESIITLDQTNNTQNIRNSDLISRKVRSSLLTSDESHIEMDKLELSNISEEVPKTNIEKIDSVTLLTSDESNIEMEKLNLSNSNDNDIKNSNVHNNSDSSNLSYKTASNNSGKYSLENSPENQENQKCMVTPIKNGIDSEVLSSNGDNHINSEHQTQTPVIDKNMELVLDQLYGTKWRNSVKKIPKTEPRKHRAIMNDYAPKTERKLNRSNVAEISTTSINFKDFAHKIRPDFESTRTPIARKMRDSFIVDDHDPEVHLNNSSAFHNSVLNRIRKPVQSQLKQALAMENYKQAIESPCIQKLKELCDPESDENSDKEITTLNKSPEQIDSCSFSMQKLCLSESVNSKINEDSLKNNDVNNDITKSSLQMEKLKISNNSNECDNNSSVKMDKLQLSDSQNNTETELQYKIVEVLTPKQPTFKVTVNTPKTDNFLTPKHTNKIKNTAQTTQGKRKLFSQRRFEDENSLINQCNDEFPEVTRLTYSSFVQNSQADDNKTYIDLAYEEMMKKIERKKKRENKWRELNNVAKEKTKPTKKSTRTEEKTKTSKKPSTESNQSESLIPTTRIVRSKKLIQSTKHSETNSDSDTTKKSKKKFDEDSSDDEYIPTPIRNKKNKLKTNSCRKFATESPSSSDSEDEQDYNTPVLKNHRPISRLAHLILNDNSSSGNSTPRRNCKKSNEKNNHIIVLTSSDDEGIQNLSDSSDTSFEMPPTPSRTKTDEKTQLSFLASLSACVSATQSHPDAPTYKLYFNDKKEELATRLFKLYNQTIFDEKIPQDTPIQWNVRMRGTAGFCYNKKTTRSTGEIERSCRIVLSSKVIDHPSRLRDTLVHEMCHAATWIVNKISDGHGPYWKAWASKAMKTYPELPRIKRCHDYEINTKYTYKCTSCGYSIGRHSKSLDIERKRCGYCYGQFELLLNRKLKNGVIKTVATPKNNKPTGFAKFVKENYNTVKGNSNMKHGDVMKLLGQKFSTLKVTGAIQLDT